MYKKIVETISALSALILLLIVIFTSPQHLGPAGLLVFYLLLYIVFLGLISDVLYYTVKIFPINLLKKNSKYSRTLTFKQAYYYSGFLAMAPLIFIALSSIGSLGFYEITLTLIFILLGCFYVSKR